MRGEDGLVTSEIRLIYVSLGQLLWDISNECSTRTVEFRVDI